MDWWRLRCWWIIFYKKLLPSKGIETLCMLQSIRVWAATVFSVECIVLTVSELGGFACMARKAGKTT